MTRTGRYPATGLTNASGGVVGSWTRRASRLPSRDRLKDEWTRSPEVTAVIGQHVHVVQPIRRVNGKPVVFGEGNFLSNQSEACCPAASQDGLIALLTVGTNTFTDAVARVAIGVDRRPEEAALVDELGPEQA